VKSSGLLRLRHTICFVEQGDPAFTAIALLYDGWFDDDGIMMVTMPPRYPLLVFFQ